MGTGFNLLLCFGLTCLGCSSPCKEVAELLRECCAKGPAELRANCEDEAKHLEQDGNSSACESALSDGVYQRCGQ
jgi:hypothetical protein